MSSQMSLETYHKKATLTRPNAISPSCDRMFLRFENFRLLYNLRPRLTHRLSDIVLTLWYYKNGLFRNWRIGMIFNYTDLGSLMCFDTRSGNPNFGSVELRHDMFGTKITAGSWSSWIPIQRRSSGAHFSVILPKIIFFLSSRKNWSDSRDLNPISIKSRRQLISED